MLTGDESSQKAGDNSSKMDEIDKSIAVLSGQQRLLDSLGFSIASIHLNEAIECLRLQKALAEQGG
jgi:hypothetical protein